MKLLNRKLSRFKAARLDLVKFRYRAGQRRERENEGRRRGWTEQGTTRKSFNTVYRRRVKERNVSESFGPRKFVTRSTCKNILGDATADLHFHRPVSIARLIFLRREILHPLAPLIELEPSMSRLTG